jgi:hypothetical protein
MHQAGAAALSELLKFDPPGPEQRQRPCACGHSARYVELRSKPVVTAVGEAECLRPYYLCDRCHRGQFPIDVELDVENTELSPGVRRMLATVGQQAAFEQGRQQMELLAGLAVTTKAVERTAEAIGADYRKAAAARAGTGPATDLSDSLRATDSSTWRGTARVFLSYLRKPKDVRGNRTANPRIREIASSRRPSWMKKAVPYETKIRPPM